MEQQAAEGEDWERQRLFYDTVRESIVSVPDIEIASVELCPQMVLSRYACWCSCVCTWPPTL